MAIVTNSASIKSIIAEIKDGELFSIGYFRKAPVCNDCGCRKNVGEVCPNCGSTNINYRCETAAQKAVANPKNATKPGHGKYIGQSAEEAEIKNNVLKYYNPNGSDSKGRGIYRSCGYERIYRLVTGGKEYLSVDADSTVVVK